MPAKKTAAPASKPASKAASKAAFAPAPPTKPAKPQLVRIARPDATDAARSKAQKEFNRLTSRIAKAEKELADFRDAATALRQRVQNEYRPLQHAHNAARAQLVRVLDRAHDEQKLSKTERRKVANIIGEFSADLPERGFSDLQPIIDKYAPPLSPEEDAEADRQTAEMMKALFEAQFGIKFDPDVDVSSPEKMQAYMDSKMAEQEAEFEAEEAEYEARRAKRKKSPKQQAAEEKKQLEEKTITKTVRGLYLDLVKVLHPDRERDEAEKIRKTVLLQQVTAAYEANELLTLLRLQLELNRIDQSHLESLAEEELRHYNKLLREQARELDEAMYEEQAEVSSFTKRPFFLVSTPTAMVRDFELQKAGLTRRVRQLEAEVLAFGHDPAAIKAFLKDYKIPKGPPAGMPMLIRL